MLTAAAVRGEGDPLVLPPGTWRDVLHGAQHQGGTTAELRDGIALFEQT